MKTRFATYNVTQAYSKRQEYIEFYGCDFSCYHTGNGWQIRPALSSKTPAVPPTPVQAGEILAALQGHDFGMSFLQLAEATKLDFRMAMSYVKWLADYRNFGTLRPAVILDTGRDAKVVGCRLNNH